MTTQDLNKMANDLLVERRQDVGMMDIGVNCSKCQQLDFLPFQCEYCKLIFCSEHRRLADHQCPYLQQFENQGNRRPKSPTQLNQATVASLFPDRAADRAKIDKLIDKPAKPTTLLETSFRVGDVKSKTAFKKFAKFLSIQLQKKNNQPKITGLFKSKKPNPTVELQLLRKNSKGDNKININDRIYFWCLYIDANETEEDKLFNIDVQKQRLGIFVNKNWLVGKALDYISDYLKIRNNNNVTNDITEKLNMFQLDANQQPLLIATNRKCKDLHTGDLLYIVRGSI